MDSKAIGELLKSRRTALGLTVQNAADRTKIKLSYIQGMESGDLTIFEAPIYVRNFVRTYARFLKIDDAQILALLSDLPSSGEASVQTDPQPISQATTIQPTRDLRQFGSKLLLMLAVGLCLVAVAFFFKTYSPNIEIASPNTVSPKTVNPQVQTNPTTQDTESESGDTHEATLIQDSPVIEKNLLSPLRTHVAQLRVLEDVWAFWESDNSEAEKYLGAGDVQNITFSSKLRLRIGKPQGVKLTVEGEEIKINSEKVFDSVFRVQENGRVTREPTSGRDLKRFRPKNNPEDNF